MMGEVLELMILACSAYIPNDPEFIWTPILVQPSKKLKIINLPKTLQKIINEKIVRYYYKNSF